MVRFAMYFVAVWKRWEACFGTTFAVILAFAQYSYLALADPKKIPQWVKSFPPWLWLAVGAILLFWSCFLAWDEQVKTLEGLRGEDHKRAELLHQRGDVTCGQVTMVMRNLSENEMCTHLWAMNSRHAGFAFEKELFYQLPDYLRNKCAMVLPDITKPIPAMEHHNARFLLTFRFPYPNFSLILEEVERLNFGNTIIVWDDSGNPIPIKRQ